MSSVRHGAAVVQRYLVSLYFIGVIHRFANLTEFMHVGFYTASNER